MGGMQSQLNFLGHFDNKVKNENNNISGCLDQYNRYTVKYFKLQKEVS